MLKPRSGFIIIESKLREGQKMKKNAAIIPPSDYFIVNGGDTGLETGQQILFGEGIRLTPVFESENQYVANVQGVVAVYDL